MSDSIRVLAVADVHLRGEGFNTPQYSALVETARLAHQLRVDLVVVLGDVFDSISTASQRLVFKHFVTTVLEQCPVHIIRGNHDQKGDLAVYGDVSSQFDTDARVHVAEEPDAREYALNQHLHVYSLPHVSLAQLAHGDSSLGNAAEEGRKELSRILESWTNDIAANTAEPSLALFHGVVSGAALDNGHIPRDNGLHLAKADLDKLGCPVLCGHYHTHQQVGDQAWYCGSPTRNNYGEAESDKGVLLLEWEAPERWEHANLGWKAPQFISLNPEPMLLFEYTWQPLEEGSNDWAWFSDVNSPAPDTCEGARVRLRYHVPADQLAQATEALDVLLEGFEGASDLKLERVIQHTAVARCKEIANTQTVKQGLAVWLEQAGKEPEAYLRLFETVVNKEKTLCV